jgi:hypothetical protein
MHNDEVEDVSQKCVKVEDVGAQNEAIRYITSSRNNYVVMYTETSTSVN